MRYTNFDVLTAVLPRILISLDVTLRRWVLGRRRFEGTYLVHLQGFSSFFGMAGTAFSAITSEKPGNLVWGTSLKMKREVFVMLHNTCRFVTVAHIRWWLNWKEDIKMRLGKIVCGNVIYCRKKLVSCWKGMLAEPLLINCRCPVNFNFIAMRSNLDGQCNRSIMISQNM